MHQKRPAAVMQAFNASQLTSPCDKGKNQVLDKSNRLPVPTNQLPLSGGAIAQNPGY